MSDTEPLPFLSRLVLAWIVYFRVLFDGGFAARVKAVREPDALRPAPSKPLLVAEEKPAPVIAKPAEPAVPIEPEAKPEPPSTEPALALLALLQREGRLVDFLQQDIAAFKDDEVGAAARVVHEGCRKALKAHATIAPLRGEDEGARVTIEAGTSPAEVKLTGNVQGRAPYKGTLRHRGWRATELSLPVAVKGHDASVLAPAEVEL